MLVSTKASFTRPFTLGLAGCSLSESTITSGEGGLLSDFMSLWSRDGELLRDHSRHHSPEPLSHRARIQTQTTGTATLPPGGRHTTACSWAVLGAHLHVPTGQALPPWKRPELHHAAQCWGS